MVDAHTVFEVVYKGVVYDVRVDRTNKLSNLKRAKREKPHELVAVDTSECEECGSVTFAGVCMNSRCLARTVEGHKARDNN